MEKYEAAMVLGAVGDAMGYKNWYWESCQSGAEIARQVTEMGGLDSILLSPDEWPVSDDTIIHIATARALLKNVEGKEELYREFSRRYVDCLGEVTPRKPDPAFLEGCSYLRPRNTVAWHIPFDSKSTGSGAATKAMCIGLRFPEETQTADLIETAVECGRMTHNHPLGFTGSFCTALFASFAVRNIPLMEWGRRMLMQVPSIITYCKKTIRHVEEYGPLWFYFETKWEMYLKARGILQENGKYSSTSNDADERDRIYRSWSSEGYPGRRGHDAPMIAYDALLATSDLNDDGERWRETCRRAMLHGGKTDATGSIAGFLYGLKYGWSGVPKTHHEQIEFRKELMQLGRLLYEKAEEPLVNPTNFYT